MGKIKNMGSATMKFGEGIIISGSVPESTLALFISGSTVINGQLHVSGSDQEGIRIAKGPNDYRQIVFETDGVDSANIHLSNAENLVIMNETAGRDIQFWVDSSAGGDIQAVTIKEDGKVGIGTDSAIAVLDVSGSIAITKATSTPSQPAPDQGFLYAKSDGKLYWRSSAVAETDLTAGGGGGATKHFATGHCDLTTNTKPVNWINASSISASSGIKSWFIVPFSATLDKIIISVKANNFNTSNDGNITLSVYKNQADYGSTIVNQTVGADDFSEKVSNMAGGSTDCNQKIFAGLNQSIAEGDLIHIKVGKSTGSDREALVTMVFEG